MKKITIKTVLLSAVFLASMVSNAYAETLDEALAYAVQNHPSIMAARAGRDGVEQSIIEEKSAYYPTVNANLSFGRVYADNTTTRGLTVDRGAGYSWFGEGRGVVNQKIYDWDQTRNRVGAAKARYQSADAFVDERMQTIEFQTTQAYVQMLRAQKIKLAADDHVASMNEYKSRIATLVKNGGADESELSRAQDIISLADNARVQAEIDLEIAKASYIEAVGRLPEGQLVEPSIDLGVMPDLMVDAIDIAVANHPQIMAARMEAQAASYESAAVSKNLLPQFDGELSYQERDQRDLIGGELVDARALIKMNWDYAFGGAQKAAQQRTLMQQQETTYAIDAIRRTIERDVRIAWASLDLAKRQKNNEYERMSAAKETLATFDEQYEGGQKSILDLMTAQMLVFNAMYAYTDLLYAELGAAYALKTIIGIQQG
jgi:adhesin transport system outer membrane protein